MAVTDRSARGALDARSIAALAAGDVVSFHIITALGLLSHGELSGLGRLLEIMQIATPFAAAWFAVASVFGAFRGDVVARPRRMLARTALSWLVALPIGLFLWSLVRQRTVQPSFALVMFFTNLVALLGWRGVFAWLASRGRSR